MTNYIDSSVFLRYLLQHQGYLDLAQIPGSFASSELLKLEIQRVLIRYRLNKEIDDSGLLSLTEQSKDLISRIDLMKLNSETIELANQNWGVILGSLDSIHLASALLIKKEKGNEIRILTHDRAFSMAARVMNLKTIGISES